MSPAEATTPARKLYFHTMMAYLDPDRITEHHRQVVAALQSVSRLVPGEDGRAAIASFAQRAAANEYYRALGDCRSLMRLSMTCSPV
jgi:flagellar protein FlbT